MFKKAKPLKDPTDTAHAYNYAMFLLNLRLRTEGEIREKMRVRGYTSEVIEKIVSQLIEQKYIEDERLAINMLESFKNYKSYGYFKVKIKLMEKRLSSSFIEQMLDEHFSIEDEMKVAKRWLEKEHSHGKTDETAIPYEEKQKLAQKLKSRGFRMDVIAKLVFDR